MRDYELVVIFDLDLGVEGQKKALAKIKKEIETVKGKVVKETEWAKKDLAYPITKKTGGRYFLLEVSLPESEVKDLDPKFRNEPGVLRHLLIRKDPTSSRQRRDSVRGTASKNGAKITK